MTDLERAASVCDSRNCAEDNADCPCCSNCAAAIRALNPSRVEELREAFTVAAMAYFDSDHVLGKMDSGEVFINDNEWTIRAEMGRRLGATRRAYTEWLNAKAAEAQAGGVGE